jgi:hypothetical protein
MAEVINRTNNIYEINIPRNNRTPFDINFNDICISCLSWTNTLKLVKKETRWDWLGGLEVKITINSKYIVLNDTDSKNRIHHLVTIKDMDYVIAGNGFKCQNNDFSLVISLIPLIKIQKGQMFKFEHKLTCFSEVKHDRQLEIISIDSNNEYEIYTFESNIEGLYLIEVKNYDSMAIAEPLNINYISIE